MAAYRLYCFSGHGKIGRVEILEAQTDEKAVRMAYERRLSVSCEVWDRDRFIAHIQALADLETERESKANYRDA